MKIILLASLVALTACGPRRPGKLGQQGKTGLNGNNGTSMGIDIVDVAPGFGCDSGGLKLSIFKDLDSNGDLDILDPITKVKLVCNGNDGQDGSNGTNGTNGTSATVSLESVSSGVDCPTGGVRISSNTSPNSQLVCNGIAGLNGEQGIQGEQGENGTIGTNGEQGIQGVPGIQGPMGPQGPQGVAGVSGTSVIPVKFCVSDNSTFPEYGLMIGSDVYAVFWGTTPASPTVAQAFLSKLVPGTYHSTGGNGCNFTQN